MGCYVIMRLGTLLMLGTLARLRLVEPKPAQSEVDRAFGSYIVSYDDGDSSRVST